ncbi:MAG: Fe-S cluster assembly protein HesB [Acidaminobacter sp.]|uniref:Fe-S cluster assembly protein HesB n=1 Tax=Acidaminobacter sp. TaxID=1872102 RepID=UPI001385D166|nr:Fe-S cluster assembly protein HesB [Acidaminobacter sp.]MZQ97065.1 Fe-S cluster assembly protein HesB [Acidaminobacter sp.]
MLRVETNPETLAEIAKVVEAQEGPRNIRIYAERNGCSGQSLGLALDEVKETDFKHKLGEVNFVIDKELFRDLGDIKIEFVGNGYLVEPVVPVEKVEKAGSGCGGGCGGCGCGGH